MKRILRTYPLTVIILLAIVWLSLGTPPSPDLGCITGIDKAAHACMYFGLTAVLWLEYLRHHDRLERKKLILLAVLAPVLFGGAMEIAQMTLTDNRQGEWLDFLSNSIGVLLGTLAGLYLIRPLVHRNR